MASQKTVGLSQISTASKVSSVKSAAVVAAGRKTKRKVSAAQEGAPVQPKRALTAYVCYTAANFSTYKREHPEAAVPDCMRALAAGWGELTEAQKKPYVKLHDADVKRFEKEKSDLDTQGFFVNKEGQDSRTLRVKVKRGKATTTAAAATDDDDDQPDAFAPQAKAVVQPKRAMTAYMYFHIANMKELRVTDPDMRIPEWSKHSSAAWGVLSEAKKAKWNTLRDKDVLRQQKELKQLETKGYFINSEGVKSTDCIVKKHRYPPGTKFPPRARSDYHYYVTENLAKICEK